MAYIFTREVKRWGVEAGDIYNADRHQIVGGTEKLLQDGIIEEEKEEELDTSLDNLLAEISEDDLYD